MRGIIGLLFILIGLCSKIDAAEITDMAGRKVKVPDQIKTVILYDNKTNMPLFPIAGSKMIAKAWAGENTNMQYISNEYLTMKEVDLKNAEEVLKLNPDIIVVGTFVNKNTKTEVSRYVKFADKINKPLIVVDLELMNLDKTYDFLGKLLGQEAESASCSQFIKSIYETVDTYTTNKDAQTVYIANAENGTTDDAIRLFTPPLC